MLGETQGWRDVEIVHLGRSCSGQLLLLLLVLLNVLLLRHVPPARARSLPYVLLSPATPELQNSTLFSTVHKQFAKQVRPGQVCVTNFGTTHTK